MFHLAAVKEVKMIYFIVFTILSGYNVINGAPTSELNHKNVRVFSHNNDDFMAILGQHESLPVLKDITYLHIAEKPYYGDTQEYSLSPRRDKVENAVNTNPSTERPFSNGPTNGPTFDDYENDDIPIPPNLPEGAKILKYHPHTLSVEQLKEINDNYKNEDVDVIVNDNGVYFIIFPDNNQGNNTKLEQGDEISKDEPEISENVEEINDDDIKTDFEHNAEFDVPEPITTTENNEEVKDELVEPMEDKIDDIPTGIEPNAELNVDEPVYTVSSNDEIKDESDIVVANFNRRKRSADEEIPEPPQLEPLDYSSLPEYIRSAISSTENPDIQEPYEPRALDISSSPDEVMARGDASGTEAAQLPEIPEPPQLEPLDYSSLPEYIRSAISSTENPDIQEPYEPKLLDFSSPPDDGMEREDASGTESVKLPEIPEPPQLEPLDYSSLSDTVRSAISSIDNPDETETYSSSSYDETSTIESTDLPKIPDPPQLEPLDYSSLPEYIRSAISSTEKPQDVTAPSESSALDYSSPPDDEASTIETTNLSVSQDIPAPPQLEPLDYSRLLENEDSTVLPTELPDIPAPPQLEPFDYSSIAESTSSAELPGNMADEALPPVLKVIDYSAEPEVVSSVVSSSELPAMPAPPQLGALDYSSLPDYIRSAISSTKMTAIPSSNDSPLKQQIRAKMADMFAKIDEPSEKEEEAKPKFRGFGMDITNDHGIVWNNLWSDPGVMFEVGNDEHHEEGSEKPVSAESPLDHQENSDDAAFEMPINEENVEHEMIEPPHDQPSADDDEEGDIFVGDMNHQDHSAHGDKQSNEFSDHHEEPIAHNDDDFNSDHSHDEETKSVNNDANLLEDEGFWNWLQEWTGEYVHMFEQHIEKIINEKITGAMEHQENHETSFENNEEASINKEDTIFVGGEETPLSQNTNFENIELRRRKHRPNKPENNDKHKKPEDKDKQDSTEIVHQKPQPSHQHNQKPQPCEQNNQNIDNENDKHSEHENNKRPNHDHNVNEISSGTIYGNTVGSEKVTNIFIFFPENKTAVLDTLKPILSDGHGQKPDEIQIPCEHKDKVDNSHIEFVPEAEKVPESIEDVENQEETHLVANKEPEMTSSEGNEQEIEQHVEEQKEETPEEFQPQENLQQQENIVPILAPVDEHHIAESYHESQQQELTKPFDNHGHHENLAPIEASENYHEQEEPESNQGIQQEELAKPFNNHGHYDNLEPIEAPEEVKEDSVLNNHEQQIPESLPELPEPFDNHGHHENLAPIEASEDEKEDPAHAHEETVSNQSLQHQEIEQPSDHIEQHEKMEPIEEPEMIKEDLIVNLNEQEKVDSTEESQQQVVEPLEHFEQEESEPIMTPETIKEDSVANNHEQNNAEKVESTEELQQQVVEPLEHFEQEESEPIMTPETIKEDSVVNNHEQNNAEKVESTEELQQQVVEPFEHFEQQEESEPIMTPETIKEDSVVNNHEQNNAEKVESTEELQQQVVEPLEHFEQHEESVPIMTPETIKEESAVNNHEQNNAESTEELQQEVVDPSGFEEQLNFDHIQETAHDNLQENIEPQKELEQKEMGGFVENPTHHENLQSIVRPHFRANA